VESERDTFSVSPANVADIKDFMHELHERLGDRKLNGGDDLTATASDLGVRGPVFLAGEPFPYEAHDDKGHDIDGRTLVLVRPSGITNPVAELKSSLRPVAGYTICLEMRLDLVQGRDLGRFLTATQTAARY
jgi:hypothetical protein